MRIVFCGGDFLATGLERMLADGHQLVEAFTLPVQSKRVLSTELRRIAAAAGAPVTEARLTPEHMHRLGGLGVDLLLSGAYAFRIPPWQGRIGYGLNLHPGPLPDGRGPWPYPWLILKGRRSSAVVLHALAPGFDEGDILARWEFPLSWRDTADSVRAKSRLVANREAPRALADLEALWRDRRPQSGGGYWPLPGPQVRQVRWTYPVGRIDRIVRAFAGNGCLAVVEGVVVSIEAAVAWPEQHDLAPGTRVLRGRADLVVAANGGFVAVTRYRILRPRR